MILSSLSLLALVAALAPGASSRTPVPAEVSRALTRALTLEGATVVPLHFAAPARCHIRDASVSQPLSGSGRVAVQYAGHGCSGFAWVDVQVWAKVAVTTRAVPKGAPLAGALAWTRREIRRGHPPYLPDENAVASRTLSAGTEIAARDVGASGFSAGGMVKVLVVSGALAVATQGRQVACGAGRLCAVLPSGKRVEGVLDANQRLVVEVP
jgi:hypothetical protein